MNTNNDLVRSYIQSISSNFAYEQTSEMGYRTAFETLIRGIFESINVRRIGHDDKAQQGNKPDFVVMKNDIPILYIEAKDIGVSLDKIEKSEQMARYYGYTNLVLTDYVEFRFYRNGERYGEPIKIADYDIKSRVITPTPENYEYVAKTLLDFTISKKEPIRSGKHLSKIMGGKAQRIRDNVRQFLSTDSERNVQLNKVYETIKKLLVHDLTRESFADMYAQTLVYGLFAARYHDPSPDSFTRREAIDLIPASNPFLRHFFDHIVGADFDKRLEYIVDELCEVFSHANVAELMKEYFKTDLWGQTHRGPDPVIHFYEDFLKEYDPELRKKMGAFYTPIPVVQFIVRSVDYLLKKEFGLIGGLSDTIKTPNGLHKVQILDPAVGTGTFISKIILNIYQNLKESGQEGRWHPYVLHDLLPRLYGFELMMTPYTIAHLKLSLAFKETGFKYFNNRRLGIYLTNALEESPTQEGLFTAFGLAESIAEESKEAAKIKNEKPIMVVIGNPPYSISSSNKGEWIQNLIRDYKQGLDEQNINSLSDDYIKFIRFAEHFIEKNGSGIVAMITNNSFIDGITHRQMRKHLLQTFDDVYILDLHGNSKKKETAPDGGKDENVFDIQQGVSINIFVRRLGEKLSLGKVYHSEIYGKRTEKFEKLNGATLENITWQSLVYSEPYYFFIPKDFGAEQVYLKGFKLDDLFVNFGSGIKFRKDNLLVKPHFNKESVMRLLTDMNTLDNSEIHTKYNFDDTSDWKLSEKKKLFQYDDVDNIKPVQYRPFDIRYTYYPLDRIAEIIPRGDSRKSLMKNLLSNNIAIQVCRQQSTFDFQHVIATRNLVDMCTVSAQTKETGYVFPLYTHHDDAERTLNLKTNIVSEIERTAGITTPEEILDYIYAILYSPNYRKKYKEFLKIDFPRIPFPRDTQEFKSIAKLGQKLLQLHLLESPKVNEFITSYPVSGSDVVDKPTYRDRNVYINDKQYFGNVPEEAWSFYIGGYQPTQKWLKDRKGQTLTNEDIEHYQKIIVSLTETDKLMKEIDMHI